MASIDAEDLPPVPNPAEAAAVPPPDGPPNYPKVLDPRTGKMISSKPANKPYLKHQAWKAREAARAAAPPSPAEDEQEPSRGWDLVKSVVWGLMLVCVLGKFVTNSPVWGYEADLQKAWTDYVVRPQMVQLNAHQLSKFDGKDVSKPLYVAISGQVYDVSPSRRIYGPGGSYHTLAGKDASRAFVTGCFQPHHLTHDLRGLTDAELVGLTNWEQFFAKSKKYRLVGDVRLPPIDPSTTPPGPCEVGKAGGTAGGEGKGAKPVEGGVQGPRKKEDL